METRRKIVYIEDWWKACKLKSQFVNWGWIEAMEWFKLRAKNGVIEFQLAINHLLSYMVKGLLTEEGTINRIKHEIW